MTSQLSVHPEKVRESLSKSLSGLPGGSHCLDSSNTLPGLQVDEISEFSSINYIIGTAD